MTVTNYNVQSIMQNYSYLRPPTKFIKSYKVPTHQLGTGQRLVYDGSQIQLSSEEAEAVHRLREYLKHKNPTKDYDTGMLLRYCYLGHFRTTDSLDKFKYYEEWCNMPNVSKDTERGILHSGVFYTYGKDGDYSPNIYFHPSRISFNDFSIQDYLICLRTLLDLVEQNMLYPSKIESWNVIIDTRNFNSKKFQQSYSVIVNNLLKIQYSYPYRLKKIFIIVAGGYSSVWSKVGLTSNSSVLIQQALGQLNLQSKCIKITNFRQLDKYIPIEERQKQYGGLLDDLYEYWPISTTNKLMEINSKFIQGSQESADYNSIINDFDFFGEKEEKTTLCNFRSCTIQ